MSDSFEIIERLVRTAAIRHGVIASNIANVDTPGYKAKDMKFEQALGSELALTTTARGHLNPAEGSLSQEGEVSDSQSWADRNNVELELEVARMTENAMLFQAGVTMLATKMRMFKNALK